MKLFLLAIICTVTLTIATDVPGWLLELQALDNDKKKCNATLRKKYDHDDSDKKVTFTKRNADPNADPDSSDEAFYEIELLPRKQKKDYNCGVTGHLKHPVTGGPAQKNINFEKCANLCVCILGKDNCKSFSFVVTNEKKGTGNCQTYPETLHHMGYTEKQGPKKPMKGFKFYNHKCFLKHHSTSSTSTIPSQATRMAKREDIVENVVVEALLGV